MNEHDWLLEARPSAPIHRLIQDGDTVVESLTLVGWVDAPHNKRDQLESYGIVTRYATYDGQRERWLRCLFSELHADFLVKLAGAGEFPHLFEACPSVGYVTTLRRPQPTDPPLRLLDWLTPASAEALVEVQAAVELSLETAATSTPEGDSTLEVPDV
jgi:hypothetical protein